jgi:hypothetical protein
LRVDGLMKDIGTGGEDAGGMESRICSENLNCVQVEEG